MSGDDSQFLLREATAGKLSRYRALLYDDEQGQALQKFKPYALPQSVGERAVLFGHYAERLRQRLGH